MAARSSAMEAVMSGTLKGGGQPSDPRLGRVPQPDERNQNYPIRTLIGAPPLREKVWRLLAKLDQGHEGACCGFGWAHELNALPVSIKVSNASARALYRRAQQLDPWPGEEPTYSGTSVLAGAQAVQEAGHLDEYRWAFDADDVLATLAAHGPVVIGVNWHAGMFKPDRNGYIAPTGAVLGGHCVCLRGILRRRGSWHVVGRNSWGASWGSGGDFKISAKHLAQLLEAGGDACVPVRRR